MLPARPSNFHCVTHTMLHLFIGLTRCVLLLGSTVIRCRFEGVNLLEKSYLFYLHEFLFCLHFFIVLHLVHSLFISCLVNGGFNPHGCYNRVAVDTDCGWSTFLKLNVKHPSSSILQLKCSCISFHCVFTSSYS